MLWASRMWSYTVSGNTYITNGSQSDVQLACEAAPDDGTVTVRIPNGTYSWSGTLNITRAISLAGESAQGVVIHNNNATASMITATSGLHGHINIYWLNIVETTNNNSGNSSGSAFSMSVDRSEPSSNTVPMGLSFGIAHLRVVVLLVWEGSRSLVQNMATRDGTLQLPLELRIRQV